MELVQGQKLKISSFTKESILEVGISCRSSAGDTIDITCFGVDKNNKLSDENYFIFYNQPESPKKEIIKLGPSGTDTERFRINLAIMPSFINRLVFTAAVDGAHSMSSISEGYIRISANGTELQRYSFNGRNFSNEKALILSEIYFKDEWRLGIVGQGFFGGLSALLKYYGGEEEEQNNGLAQHSGTSGKTSSAPSGTAHIGKTDSDYPRQSNQERSQGSFERSPQRHSGLGNTQNNQQNQQQIKAPVQPYAAQPAAKAAPSLSINSVQPARPALQQTAPINRIQTVPSAPAAQPAPAPAAYASAPKAAAAQIPSAQHQPALQAPAAAPQTKAPAVPPSILTESAPVCRFNLNGLQAPALKLSLTWNTSEEAKQLLKGRRADQQLDLGCMVMLKDGQKFLVQSLGNNIGSENSAPYITINKVRSINAQTEVIKIYKPEAVERAVFFTFIYKGALDFTMLDSAIIMSSADHRSAVVPMTSPQPKKMFCAVCSLINQNGAVQIKREELYFGSHQEADSHFRFNFNWIDAK